MVSVEKMKSIVVKVKKEECKDSCPIPLNLVSNVEKAIKKINYNNKTEVAKIEYDESLMSEKQVLDKLRKIGYKIIK